MLQVLRQRNFALLWWGALISYMGDWVLFVSLPLYVLNLTGSVAAMGALFIINMLPGIILGSAAGVFVDRWDRKKILVVTNLMLGALYPVLLLFNNASGVWMVYLVGFAGNIIRQFSNPAETALLPNLIGKEQLPTAIALNSLNNNLARLVGPAAGGILFALFGFHSALMLDVATFFIGAGLISLIKAPASVTRAERHEHEQSALSLRGFVAEWLSGLRLVKNSHILFWLFVAFGVNNIIDGIITVLLTVYVKQALGGGSIELGWLFTGQAIGGLLGATVIGMVSKRVKPAHLIGFGFAFMGLFNLLLFAVPVLPLNIVLFGLAGFSIVALEVGGLTLFQNSTDDRYRGRVWGAFGTTSSFLLLIGRTIATLVGGSVNVALLLSVVSAFAIVAGAVALRMLTVPEAAKATITSEIGPASA